MVIIVIGSFLPIIFIQEHISISELPERVGQPDCQVQKKNCFIFPKGVINFLIWKFAVDVLVSYNMVNSFVLKSCFDFFLLNFILILDIYNMKYADCYDIYFIVNYFNETCNFSDVFPVSGCMLISIDWTVT